MVGADGRSRAPSTGCWSPLTPGVFSQFGGCFLSRQPRRSRCIYRAGQSGARRLCQATQARCCWQGRTKMPPTRWKGDKEEGKANHSQTLNSLTPSRLQTAPLTSPAGIGSSCPFPLTPWEGRQKMLNCSRIPPNQLQTPGCSILGERGSPEGWEQLHRAPPARNEVITSSPQTSS